MNAVHILHLEDDPADARLMHEQLRRAGLEATINLVTTREAFEAALADGSFDLVLSDYHVPRFSGRDALELVRSRDAHLPFILVTGALGDERAVDILQGGATDFVLKDRLARLAPAIRRALSERAVQKEHEDIQGRLAAAQRLSKLAAEAARMGTWQLDVASGRLECSEEFLALIGLQRAEWPGSASAFEALVHSEDVERRRQVYDQALVHGGFMELEFRIRKPDGEIRWMHSRGDCWRGTDGAPATFFGVMMDITARKGMEEALRNADRRKDEFLAMLAHELRNPLAPIHNGLSLLRRSDPQPPEVQRIHAMLDRQVKHIIRLVDDLLDVSRITLGKIALKRAPVELATIVQSAVEMSRPFIEAAGHRLEVEMPSQPVILDVDFVRITQALSNLLNNAAKYTEQGGRIWVGAQPNHDQVEISIRDNGVGIANEMLDRVFDLFVQGQDYEGLALPGLGVGLTMVRLLVNMHGGEVQARSDGAGKGSEFLVRLPLCNGASVAVAWEAVKAAGPEWQKFRVLVVDDNRDSADSLAMLLRLSRADAATAYDGASALEAISFHQPDVVILDLAMPGMDGYAVAQQIRQNPRNKRMTLIALTGWGQEEHRLRSLAAGFNHHLTKPVDLNALQALLAALEPVGERKPTVADR